MKRLSKDELSFIENNCHRPIRWISRELKRERSTISYWLQYYRDKNNIVVDKSLKHGTEGGMATKIKNELVAIQKANDLFEKYKNDIRFLIGLNLYWAEGAKGRFNFTNSDVDMINFMTFWIKNYFENTEILLTVYANEENRLNAVKFWSNTLDMSLYKNIKNYKSVIGVRKETGVLKMEVSGFKLFRLVIKRLFELNVLHLKSSIEIDKI